MGAAPSKSKDLSLRNILIFVLYSGVLIIMFVLLAKRQIKRMRLRYDTNFETRQVMGFPKHYRNGSKIISRVETFSRIVIGQQVLCWRNTDQSFLLLIRASTWNEYVFGLMSHPTYVISLSPQTKWYVLIWYRYLIPLTCLKNSPNDSDFVGYGFQS